MLTLGKHLLGAIVALALLSQAATLIIAGHRPYLWVQGLQAIAASIPLLIFGLRNIGRDVPIPLWPPLLPLAAIALTGGVKDIYVATDAPTPLWLIVLLLTAVLWFAATAWPRRYKPPQAQP